MSEDQDQAAHSVHEVNKAIRVLSGKPLKHTVRVHKTDGAVIEWQCEEKPELKWHDESRCLTLRDGAYPHSVIMMWEAGMICLTEENPK